MTNIFDTMDRLATDFFRTSDEFIAREKAKSVRIPVTAYSEVTHIGDAILLLQDSIQGTKRIKTINNTIYVVEEI